MDADNVVRMHLHPTCLSLWLQGAEVTLLKLRNKVIQGF
jgi:hypothetical protein